MEKKLLEKECPNDDMLYRYIEGMLNGKERKRIEKHVNQCEHCLHAMAELVKHSLAPADSEEREQLRALGGLTADEQADEVIRWNASLNQGKAAGDTSMEISFGEKVKSYLDRWMPGIPKPAYVAVGIIGLLLILAGPRQYNIWQSNRLAESGLGQFIENYYITSTDAPRPSGGFEFSVFTNTRGDNKEEIYKNIMELFQKAIEKNDKNLNAYLYLGTYHAIVSKDFDSAYNAYSRCLEIDPTNSHVLNNIGQLYLLRGDHENAEIFLHRALKFQPDLQEAHYNLAVLYNLLGDSIKAKNSWKAYTLLDSTTQWGKIASAKLTE